MSGIAASGTGNGRALVDQLLEVAGSAHRAAYFADGEYIPQMSREHELRASFNDSANAALALEQLAPQLAMLAGGDDCLQLAKRALNQIASGRMVLRDGVAVDDDLVRGGTLVEDAIATHAAGTFFREAEALIRGLADLALLEVDDARRGVRGAAQPSPVDVALAHHGFTMSETASVDAYAPGSCDADDPNSKSEQDVLYRGIESGSHVNHL